MPGTHANFYQRNARLYDPVSLCLSVCVCVYLNQPSWFLAWELHSTLPTLCFKEIQVSPKIRVLPSGTLPQTLDLENFAMAYRSSKRVVTLNIRPIRVAYDWPLCKYMTSSTKPEVRYVYGTKVCRYNWHSAGSLGWPVAISNAKI